MSRQILSLEEFGLELVSIHKIAKQTFAELPTNQMIQSSNAAKKKSKEPQSKFDQELQRGSRNPWVVKLHGRWDVDFVTLQLHTHSFSC